MRTLNIPFWFHSAYTSKMTLTPSVLFQSLAILLKKDFLPYVVYWRVQQMAIFTLSSLNRICTYLRVATRLVLLHKLSKNHPNGTRTRISSVKGWYPRPVRRWGVKAVFYGTATRRKEVFKIYRSRVTLEWFEHSLYGWEPDLLSR